MPVLIPLAVGLAASVGALASGIAATVGLAVGLSAAFVAGIIGTVVSTAATFLMSAMMRPRPQRPEFQDRRQSVRSAISPRQVIYGDARVGGAIVFAGSAGEDLREMHLVVALAGHPCDEVRTIWINDLSIQVSELGVNGDIINPFHTLFKKGPLGPFDPSGQSLANIRIYLGDQVGADPILLSAFPDKWSHDHVLTGVTYLAIRLIYDRDKFPGGLQNISAELRGKNTIFDPRDGETRATANWALCVRDYLLSPDGLACSAAEIDEASFAAAANLSDEVVQLDEAATQFEPRYRLDGAFTLDRAPIEVMEEMLSAGAGTLVYVQGQYRLYGGAYATPSLSLGPTDFAGDIQLLTKPPRREVFNAIRGTYIAAAKDWQVAEFPPLTFSAFEAEDGERIWRDLRLPFTFAPTAAQRLARIATLTARDSLRFTAPMKYGALRLACWQMVSVTHPDFGWDAKPFRVESWRFDPSSGEIVVSFREENAGNYAWTWENRVAEPPFPPTTLVSPLDIPAPTGLTATPSTVMQPDGSLAASLIITWNAAAHPFVTSHEVQWRLPNGEWSGLEVPLQEVPPP